MFTNRSLPLAPQVAAALKHTTHPFSCTQRSDLRVVVLRKDEFTECHDTHTSVQLHLCSGEKFFVEHTAHDYVPSTTPDPTLECSEEEDEEEEDTTPDTKQQEEEGEQLSPLLRAFESIMCQIKICFNVPEAAFSRTNPPPIKCGRPTNPDYDLSVFISRRATVQALTDAIAKKLKPVRIAPHTHASTTHPQLRLRKRARGLIIKGNAYAHVWVWVCMCGQFFLYSSSFFVVENAPSDIYVYVRVCATSIYRCKSQSSRSRPERR